MMSDEGEEREGEGRENVGEREGVREEEGDKGL